MLRRILILASVWMAAEAQPPATPLFVRGYSVIPTPKQVDFHGGDVAFAGGWGIDAGTIPANHIAVRWLRQDLKEFHGVEAASGAPNTVHLSIRSGAGDPQGYRLRVAANSVEIAGNSGQGVFYGVQTFLQLLRPAPGGWRLPAATIEDAPARELRFLHWDTKHHQDRMETLKRYLDWSARLKVNRIGFELEDKFAYPSVPDVGAPGAFTPAELQEIVNYGLERFIEVIPVIQAPAHLGYVLKHPRYAHLRADGNNYQADLCKEETFELIFKMYDDVIAATRGVDGLFVSTDEVYYAGIGGTCQEPYNPENRSRHWARFVQRARDHLASKNRRMFAWIEYPLLPHHIPLIPADVVDGVMGEAEYAAYEKQRGMRQLSYTSFQGEEFLFPNYFRMDEYGVSAGSLERVSESIASGPVTGLRPIGVFGAAWDDSGLHNETFWLGWSAVANWGWHPGGVSVEQHTAEFARLYYGPESRDIAEIYRDLEHQARAWQRSWDRIESRTRKPGYGNSNGPGVGTRRYDYTWTPPAIPSLPALRYEAGFAKRYESWVAKAPALIWENAKLRDRLAANLAAAGRNRVNLSILLAHAAFIDHHWQLLLAMTEAEKALLRASEAGATGKHADAVGEMLAARQIADRQLRAFRRSFGHLKEAFEATQFPKGRAAGGRTFVQVLDDTKDHFGGRTADLSYLAAPEQLFGLAEWQAGLSRVLEAYAKEHHLPVKALEEKEEE